MRVGNNPVRAIRFGGYVAAKQEKEKEKLSKESQENMI